MRGELDAHKAYVCLSSSAQICAGFDVLCFDRYIDWFFTTPLLLLDLMVMAAVPVAVVTW